MTDRPLREVMARGMYEDEHTGPNDTPWPELPDVHRMAFGHLADAAIEALEASGWVLVPVEPRQSGARAIPMPNHPLPIRAGDDE